MLRHGIVFSKIEPTGSSLHDVSKHNSAGFFVHFGFECESILQRNATLAGLGKALK